MKKVNEIKEVCEAIQQDMVIRQLINEQKMILRELKDISTQQKVSLEELKLFIEGLAVNE